MRKNQQRLKKLLDQLRNNKGKQQLSKRADDILKLIRSRKDNSSYLSAEFKVNKEGMDYLFIDICQEAAMAGAVHGTKVGMKVVESNPISFAKTVLKELRKIAPMGGTNGSSK